MRTFNDFTGLRDLENVIVWSIPILEAKGIDPDAFYQSIIENPQIIEGWKTNVGAGAGIGAGIGSAIGTPGVGTAIGAGLGAAAGGLYSAGKWAHNKLMSPTKHNPNTGRDEPKGKPNWYQQQLDPTAKRIAGQYKRQEDIAGAVQQLQAAGIQVPPDLKAIADNPVAADEYQKAAANDKIAKLRQQYGIKEPPTAQLYNQTPQGQAAQAAPGSTNRPWGRGATPPNQPQQAPNPSAPTPAPAGKGTPQINVQSAAKAIMQKIQYKGKPSTRAFAKAAPEIIKLLQQIAQTP